MNSTPDTKEMRKVKYVQPLSRYVLFVELSDGEYGYFDVKPYLEMGVFKELKDVDYFKKVRPVLGGISWPNEQDFSADTLAAGLVKDSIVEEIREFRDAHSRKFGHDLDSIVKTLQHRELFPPVMKTAIDLYAPEYFELDADAQQRFRANIPGDVEESIRRYLFSEVLGITVADEDELDDMRWDITNAQWAQINSLLLLIKGVGEDFFQLNEYLQDGVSVLDFQTLYDYDYQDFCFQETWRKKEFKNHQPGPYEGSLFGEWARLMVDGEFTYAYLSMKAGYILSCLDTFGDELIEKLIPTVWEEGPDHDKQCDHNPNLYQWDMRQNAYGFEKEHAELQKKFWEYLDDRLGAMEAEFSKEPTSRVFIIPDHQKDERNLHFIFSNKFALPKIHFTSFLKDCRANEETDHTSLEARIEEEKQLLESFLTTQFSVIVDSSPSSRNPHAN